MEIDVCGGGAPEGRPAVPGREAFRLAHCTHKGDESVKRGAETTFCYGRAAARAAGWACKRLHIWLGSPTIDQITITPS
ncbi:hypothetical protein [Demequina sediminis]|uniref:hypothetical protein n=1 Tax=Demequina sediminis TaxID=1930058 RepID=UPI0025745631|nr:hypothetical protein [Demequina sediminis]BDZ62768.1 hypothetical protein GCM10025873_25590 [Demequina sediminis]